MTNTPRFIVVHHSATPRGLSLEQSVASFNRTHGRRLHAGKNGYGHHIAYHYVIAADGSRAATRPELEAGYHTGSWQKNHESIGICLLGNFQTEHPTGGQLAQLEDLIRDVRQRYRISAEHVAGHRAFSRTSCPGRHLSDEMVERLAMQDVRESSPSPWAREAWEAAVRDKVISDRFPRRTVTLEEVEWMLKNAGLLTKVTGNLTRERCVVALQKLRAKAGARFSYITPYDHI